MQDAQELQYVLVTKYGVKDIRKHLRVSLIFPALVILLIKLTEAENGAMLSTAFFMGKRKGVGRIGQVFEFASLLASVITGVLEAKGYTKRGPRR